MFLSYYIIFSELNLMRKKLFHAENNYLLDFAVVGVDFRCHCMI